MKQIRRKLGMKRYHKIHKRIIMGIIIGMLVCLGPFQSLPALAESPNDTLRIALLPILDVLPFYVAEAEGFFSGSRFKIEAIPVASGLDRDQLMQAGEIDGMLNEMTTTGSFNRDGVQVKILISARRADTRFPMFRVLASPKSGLKSPPDLAGVPIGVSMNTIIEYVTDRMLAERGLPREKIVMTSVPVIPERYQLLMQGQLKAATLPDPLGISALAAGAVSMVDDSAYPHYSVSVLSFSVKALKNKGEGIRFFLKGWDRAAEKINADPGAYRAILLEKIRVPKNVQEGYPVPNYPRKEVPGADQWADVMTWMVGKGLLTAPLPYEESVTNAFLPQ
jgi:NitT/TauT family transport system substrate-binding protein